MLSSPKYSSRRQAGGHLRVVILLSLLSLVTAQAQDKGFGIGVILGEPTGLSAKGWLQSNNAIDGGLAWSFRGTGYIHMHADYLWHFPNAIRSSERFVPYAGPGIRLGGGKGGSVFGIRVAGGIAFWPRGAPIDVFVELAPIVDLAPTTEVSFNAGLGVRFFFK